MNDSSLYTIIVSVVCVVAFIFLFIFANKRNKRLIEKIVNDTAELTAKKVLEVIKPEMPQTNEIGSESGIYQEFTFREADGRDILEILYNTDNEENLNLITDGDISIKAKQVMTLWYDDEKGYRDTFAAVSFYTDAECNELDEKVYFLRVFQSSDGTQYLKNVTDFETIVRVYTDYGKKTGATDKEIAERIAKIKTVYENANANAKTEVNAATPEKRRRGFKEGEKAKHLPDSKWFTSHGMRLKEIPVEKKVLKSFSYNDKTLIALSTYPTFKRNIFLILGMVTALAAIILFGGLIVKNIEFLIVAMIIFVAGSFVTQKLFGVLDGFEILGGTRLIKIPVIIHILYRIAYPLGGLWGMISQMIFMLLDSFRRQKMLGLPRVVMPQNCGFDEFIEYYSEYEASCSLADAKKQHEAHQSKDEYYNKQKAIKNLKKSVAADKNLSDTDKQNLIAKANENLKKNEKAYENEIKPNL